MNAGLVNRITDEVKDLIKERKQGLTTIPYDVIYHDYFLNFLSKFMRFCFFFSPLNRNKNLIKVRVNAKEIYWLIFCQNFLSRALAIIFGGFCAPVDRQKMNAMITVWKPACGTCEGKENRNYLGQLPFFNQNKDHQKGLLCLLCV